MFERGYRMMARVLGVLLGCLGVLAFAGCGGSAAETRKPAVEIVLKQGPVSAWRIPVLRQGEADVVCRYHITGADGPREYPLRDDSLILTIVEWDNALIITHRYEPGADVTFKVEHPVPEYCQWEGPHVVSAGPEEQTVWRKAWLSRETNEEVFRVELTVCLPTAAP